MKPADGTGESLARAFGRDASSLADGFSLMSPEVKVDPDDKLYPKLAQAKARFSQGQNLALTVSIMPTSLSRLLTHEPRGQGARAIFPWIFREGTVTSKVSTGASKRCTRHVRESLREASGDVAHP